MTKKKDPQVEQAVDTFMWQVYRHDTIVRSCRKPTSGERMWWGGYTAAMQTILDTMADAWSRSGSSGAALADVAEVALMALELGDVEPRAAVWADQLPERQP
ncbi:MAG: hypothetical protein WAK71_27330 [Streptosporangiaceae bacterium]